MKKIEESESDWKANYMANWGYSYCLEEKFSKTPKWDIKIKFGLPAFGKGYYEYVPAELYRIIRSKDVRNTYENLIIIFSVFEVLLEETSKILEVFGSPFSKWENMENFFKKESTKDILKPSQLKELKLAKMTRNCYLHRGGKADEGWIDSYRKAKGTPLISEGEDLNKGFEEGIPYHQIEEWHNLIVEITNKIKNKIEEI